MSQGVLVTRNRNLLNRGSNNDEKGEAMISKEEAVSAVKTSGVVAIIRMSSPEKIIAIARALKKGGIRCIEIPMTVPTALDLIKEAARDTGSDFIIGAGTVLDAETARGAILAGAEFIVDPSTDFDMIKLCKRYRKMVIPGAFTPKEVLEAWEAGADIVKVFPARFFGPKYFSDLKGPFPQIELMPTGGVEIDNAADFIRAGACAVTIGGDLLDKKAVDEGDFDEITARATKLVGNIRQVKKEIETN